MSTLHHVQRLFWSVISFPLITSSLEQLVLCLKYPFNENHYESHGWIHHTFSNYDTRGYDVPLIIYDDYVSFTIFIQDCHPEASLVNFIPESITRDRCGTSCRVDKSVTTLYIREFCGMCSHFICQTNLLSSHKTCFKHVS